jgi:predicted glycogen debranching enzyme
LLYDFARLAQIGLTDFIDLAREICRDFSRSSRLEWLETNGAGGYAMGTAAGVNTRRYHGLLIASLHPPVERVVMLARVEEELTINERSYSLGVCQYPGIVTPSGYRYLERFRLDPFPTWDYLLDDVHVEKKLFLVQGRQAVVLAYTSNTPHRMRLRPFVALRDYHSLNATDLERLAMLRFHPSNCAALEPDAHWYRNVEYLRELDRGFDFREDLYSPGYFTLDLQPGRAAWLVACIEGDLRPDDEWVARAESLERERRPRNLLERAADQFIVHRGDGSPTIIAGYPWFTDWGRDTMISLPGLLIGRGRLDEARDIVQGFLKFLHQGLIPNRFPDYGERPEYNSADSTLWIFPAMHAWLEAGGDFSFVRDIVYPAACEIIAWQRGGTLNDIGVDPVDSLLSAGAPGMQLTWMDAKTGDWVVTPRHGKPVEINALWYNALRITASWASQIGDQSSASRFEEESEVVRDSFNRLFWNPDRECLYDCIAPGGDPVVKVRPNQIFAVSLPFPVIDGSRARSVVEIAARELLTPVGLRTLERGDPDYHPAYCGSALERDGAYHQGTVWPWLVGPFITASLRVYGRTPEMIACCRAILESVIAEMADPSGDAALGTLGEIYSAEPPHLACGAVAQAWSVAELLRALQLVSEADDGTPPEGRVRAK